MTRFLLLFAALVLGAPALAQSEAPAEESASAAEYPEDAPDWKPFGEAAEAARSDGDLVLIHAYTVWCGWCRRLDHDVYTDDTVQAYLAEHYEVTRVDIESPETINFFGAQAPMREIGQVFEVRSTPTTVFFDAEGNYITKLSGYQPAERFLLVLRYVREAAYEMMPFDAYVEMMEAGAAQGG